MLNIHFPFNHEQKQLRDSNVHDQMALARDEKDKVD